MRSCVCARQRNDEDAASRPRSHSSSSFDCSYHLDLIHHHRSIAAYHLDLIHHRSIAAYTMEDRIAKPEPARGATAEVYGFVGWITSFLALGAYLVWAYVPDSVLRHAGFTYLPDKYAAVISRTCCAPC